MTSKRWQQVEQLYYAALEQDETQRAAFLKEACAGDEAVLREVESLLECDPQLKSFMEAPALELAAQGLAKNQSQSLVGQRIGSYQVLAFIGAGGMGEVYRARDARLGREVAIKVLPAAFSGDRDRLRRFDQEARAAGKINHPNILAVHDVGTHEGSPYIVSELLEGETLRDRLKGATLPLRKAIDYALQMARGLAAAHQKGIVHRDLKPENLFITRDGRLKILDFGLAKLTQPRVESGQLTAASAGSTGTHPGVVLGTVGYMSPEQVRGQAVDHRSDLFAFGAIFYEMLCGRRAFQGESAVETMNAILQADPPDFSQTSRNIPAALERIVRHCLEKSPEERYQSAGDIAFNLEALSSATSDSLGPLPARQASRQRLGWILAVVLVFALLALAAVAYFRHEPANVRAITLSLLLPENVIFSEYEAPIISPDGGLLAFVATDSSGKSLLWIRPLDAPSAQALPGTEGAYRPFWSPDSHWIGFFAQGKLKKIEVSGGPPQTVCDAAVGAGGTWNREGVIVFAPTTELYRVSAAGGVPTSLTRLDQSHQELLHCWPHFLPDGRHFVYTVYSAQREVRGIYVGSLDLRPTQRLLAADSSAAYVPPGYLLFMREGTLLAQPLDPKHLQLTGRETIIPHHVAYDLGTVRGSFSVSETGMLAYWGGGDRQLVWHDRAGKRLGQLGSPGAYQDLRLSPDEKSVAMTSFDRKAGGSDIWLLDLSRGVPSRFTFDPSYDTRPIWSPDGSRIVFTSLRDSTWNLYQKASSGAGKDEALLKSSDNKYPTDWSRDGRFITYANVSPKGNFDLWLLPMFGEAKPIPFLQTEFTEFGGQFSPDGRWMAYVSNESGRFEVYVQPFPVPGRKVQVSMAGAQTPKWRSDGKELFYLALDGKLMAVAVKTGAVFETGISKALFETSLVHPWTNYAVSNDGQRFLISQRETTPLAFTVVINWAAELKR